MLSARIARTSPLIALVALVVTSCSGSGVETDHRTHGQAPEPLSSAGPQPGRFEPAWEVTFDDEPPAAFHLISGQLVAVTDGGLQAFDARTGEATWHYREPGRELRGLAESDGAIVVESVLIEEDAEQDVSISVEHLVGLDAGTGELLWERAEAWSLTAGGRPTTGIGELGDAAAGVVVVELDSPFERAGLDARTGDERWRVSAHQVADSCEPATGDSDGPAQDVVLVVLSCDVPRRVAIGLDAESGDVRWRRTLPRIDAPWTGMRDGIALVGSPDRVALVGPDGQDVYRDDRAVACPCELYSAGDHVVLEYGTPGGTRRVSVDRASAAVTELPEWTEVAGVGLATATADGALYGVGTAPASVSHRLLPWMVGITDLATGEHTFAPVPLSTFDWPRIAWLGAADERLFVASVPSVSTADPSGQSTAATQQAGSTPPIVLTSYTVSATQGPVELGGVSPQDWPEPCGLLSGLPRDEDDDIRPDVVDLADPLRLGTVTLPPLTCSAWLPERDVLRLDLVWVAATDEQARPLLGDGDAAEVARRDLDETTMLLRAGRTIMVLTFDPDTPDQLRETIVETVVANVAESSG